ncbi:MAG: tetratricopeptide repeat protein [Nevskia sp.]|nr:tetratricopeptide repeat protein [Nevskia sp.]
MAQWLKLAILVAFVALIGLFTWRIFFNKKEALPDFRAKAGQTAVKMPPLGPKPAAPPAKPSVTKLGDTASIQVPPELAAPPRMDAGATAVIEPSLTATTILDQPPKQTPPTPVGAGDVDFDMTSQLEAQTLSINLDANDPLSEADFHLAYGLYDEAASLLKQALTKEPKRTELRTKLAETYFAAGKPVEFQETAEALNHQLTPSDWQKIAIMGRQLCPDAALFKGDGGGVLSPDVDLPLDEAPPEPAAAQPAAQPATPAAPPAVPQPAPATVASAAANVIDFDLDSELLKPDAAAGPAAAAPAPDHEADAPHEIDLSHFDIGGDEAAAGGSEGTVEFNLDELDLSKPASGNGAGSDEIGTKLDLARAYADMGDNEAAKSLLDEVIATGSAEQKSEAEALVKRLSA